jgi:hypothetical protein
VYLLAGKMAITCRILILFVSHPHAMPKGMPLYPFD